MKFKRSRIDKKFRKLNVRMLELESRVKILEDKIKRMSEDEPDQAAGYTTE
jgi:hypothetical protein